MFAPDAPSRKVRAHDHILDFGRVDARALDRMLEHVPPGVRAGCVMLSAPRQDFASAVRAVETMTASVMIAFSSSAKLPCSAASLSNSGAGRHASG